MPSRILEDHQKEQEDKAKKPLFLPYVRGVSEKLKKVCIPLGVKPIFKPQNTLRNMLMHVKENTPIERKKEIVYEVSCQDCQMKNIGETKRSMKRRMTKYTDKCTDML